MRTRKLVPAVVAVVTAVLFPGSAATASTAAEASLRMCPDGYRGIVVGVFTEETGYREVRVCYKNPPPTTGE